MAHMLTTLLQEVLLSIVLGPHLQNSQIEALNQ